jgi:hypothetical protein
MAKRSGVESYLAVSDWKISEKSRENIFQSGVIDKPPILPGTQGI